MYNKFFSLILCIISTLGFVACTQTNSKSNNQSSVAIADGNITISDDSKPSFSLQVKVGDGLSYTRDVKANQKTSLLNLLKGNKEAYNDIALLLAKSNGDVKLNLSIVDVLDTTITYHLDVKDASQYSTKSSSR